jgi:5-methyltetrahydrofolate--homocysteine methyltransferase
MEVKMDLLNQISQYLQDGDEEKVFELVKEAIDQGNTAQDILNRGLIAGMNIVGQRFKVHEIFLPDVLMSAKAMVAGMEELKPLLIKTGIPSRGKVVLGTVQGDLHDIGKNLVGVMLKGAGFEVIDLGNDVPPEEFLRAASDRQATIIGMSALLTTTMPVMKSVVDLIKEKNLSGKIKTIIGGAPVTKEYAQEIGADKYSYDASHAVESVKELLGVN